MENINDVIPLVSIVIPTYNRGDLLGAALESVFAQTYKRVEVIVVDDGSSDNTPEVVQPYLDRLIYLRKTNGGLSSARNAGMRRASGTYMALMDSDDLCEPERLALGVAYLERNPDVVLCSSDFSAFDGSVVRERSHIASYYGAFKHAIDGAASIYPETGQLDPESVPWLRSRGLAPLRTYQGRVYERLAWGNFIHPPTVLVRRSVSETIGDFDEAIPYVADYDWFLRASRLGPIGYLDVPLLKYRYSPDQMSSDRHTAKIAYGNVTILTKLRQADPAFFAAHRAEFRRRLGGCYQSAANALADSNRRRAFAELARSVAHGVLNGQALRILMKLMLPRSVIEWRRRDLAADERAA